jgi:hypothetical protein
LSTAILNSVCVNPSGYNEYYLTSIDKSYFLVWLLNPRILNSEVTLLIAYIKDGDQEIKQKILKEQLIVGFTA